MNHRLTTAAEAAADAQRSTHHLYVHVPFCRLVCAYCDFVTVGGRADAIPSYVDAVVDELGLRPAPGRLRTVYFGGGTPSLLDAEQVARILAAARSRWSARTVEEVTLEANPSSREAPDWVGLRAAGVTRISLGVQSMLDPALRALARGHTAAEAREAYTDARRAGFDNVSLDLIYGIPGQSLGDWRRGLLEAVALEPDHVSCYALQLVLAPDEWAAPPRPGALRWRARLAAAQDDGLAAEQYRMAEEVLGHSGFQHYELSSWARRGCESRHNGAYWSRRPYTGVGAGAHSYDGATSRSWNTRDLDGYVKTARAGRRPIAGEEELDHETRSFEAIALGLRRIDGLSRAAYRAEFGLDPVEHYADAVSTGIGAGLLELDGDALRLSARGRLLASEALIAFAPTAPPVR